MNCGWDIALAYEIYHKKNRAIMPKKNHIWLPLALEEDVLPSHVTDEVMNQMFIMHSHTVRRAIPHIIGEEILFPLKLLFLYPS